jgi:hypothetical protein
MQWISAEAHVNAGIYQDQTAHHYIDKLDLASSFKCTYLDTDPNN